MKNWKNVCRGLGLFFLLGILVIGPSSGIAKEGESRNETEINRLKNQKVQDVYEAKTKLIVHYDPKEMPQREWQMWIWNNSGVAGQEIEFEQTNDYGRFSRIAVIEVAGIQAEIGFIIKDGTGWSGGKDGDGDRYVETKEGISEIWVENGQDTFSLLPPEDVPLPQFTTLDVTFHYHRDDANYEKWFVHSWADGGKEKQPVLFSTGESDGTWQSVSTTYEATPGKQLSKIDFLIARVVDGEWEKDGTENDRVIYLFDKQGHADVWLVENDEINYRNPYFAEAEKRIKEATIEDFHTIKVELNRSVSELDIKKLIQVTQNLQEIEIEEIKMDDKKNNQVIIKTKNEINITEELAVNVTGFGNIQLDTGGIVRHPDFDAKYAYTGTEPLGATFTEEATTWRLWAPTAKKVNLVLYETADPESAIKEKVTMNSKEQGIWDLKKQVPSGTAYTYELFFANNKVSAATDPYATAATVNGNRSVVLSHNAKNPESWEEQRMPAFSSPTDALIYEMHIRDFSIANSETVNKGKYLGVVQTGTKSVSGYATGIDYLKELGITHVQILPMYDYASLDEAKHKNMSEQLGALPYNWGYDPKNYNVPEGSYSTNPFDPETRIHEMKQMIQGLHQNNIRVIMDVVYNHVYDAGTHAFEKTVPGYYFRYNEEGKLANGTGVGNDTASKRVMMQKFIVDSVTYWAKEYHIDGFRFDLMGIHDVATMNAVRTALNEIDPSIIVLGEGWDLGTPLASEQKASQKNASKMPGIAHFNDSIRDGIKGSTWGGQEAEPGFANGAFGKEIQVAQNLLAGSLRDLNQGIYDFSSPDQVIQYVEAHDNLTLWDKIGYSNAGDSDVVKKQIHQLATSTILFAQGTPFIHAGQEFFRTKNGDENSYESADTTNLLDWQRYDENIEAVQYIKSLIALRKEEPLFRLTSYEQINQKMTIIQQKEQVIGYELKDETKAYVVLFNANRESKSVAIPAGQYQVKIGATETDTAQTIQQVKVPALSTLVLKSETTEVVPVKDLILSAKSLEILKLGKQLVVSTELTPTQTTMTHIVWESANEKIATVSSAGIVNAKANGTTKITATTENGLKKSFTIRVSN